MPCALMAFGGDRLVLLPERIRGGEVKGEVPQEFRAEGEKPFTSHSVPLNWQNQPEPKSMKTKGVTNEGQNGFME